MKRFLVKLLGFIFTLFSISFFLGYFLPNRKYYGNEIFEKKISIIREKKENYNLFYFGSSRVATGVNPDVFDSLMKLDDRNTNSFNMATYGTWFNEDIYILESFIKETNLRNATIFIELQNVMSINWSDIDNDKNLYHQNFNNYSFVFKYVLGRKINSLRDVFINAHYLLTYSISELLYNLNVGKSDCFELVNSSLIDFDNNGFKQLLSIGSINRNTIASYQIGTENLFESTEEVGNDAFLNKIIDVIEKADDRNILLVFILTPKNYTPEMVGIYRSIPIGNKIRYSNFLAQDSLFDKKNWADGTHLNIYGAKVYTEFLVKEYLALHCQGSDFSK